MKILEALTPKAILFNVLKEKFAEAGIDKIILVFKLADDTYNVMVSTAEGQNMKLDITTNEITTIKKLFIRRIVTKWNERFKEEPKSVILEVDVAHELFNIFILDTKDKTLKFDY